MFPSNLCCDVNLSRFSQSKLGKRREVIRDLITKLGPKTQDTVYLSEQTVIDSSHCDVIDEPEKQ